MILYYALTTYHIQCCVLHKLTRRPDEKAVLLLSDIHKNSVAFLNRYSESGIFDEVYLLEESAINAEIRRRGSKNKSKISILNYACKEIKKVLPVNVAKMNEVYLCPDHFPFGWYIIKNGIKYHCFEEGCGVLSDREFMLSNMSRNKTQYELMDVLGYFGENQYAVEVLADVQSQKEGYTNEKMTDFSVKRILSQLSPQDMQRTLKFFGVEKKVKADAGSLGLVLTQHMANLGIMSLEDQHLLYKLLADYFIPDKHIVVKPHPDDITGRYSEIYGDSADVLPFAMPSELLPYCLEGQLSTAMAANSTAVKAFEGECRTINFDQRILTDFRHIHRYFAVVEILKQLKSDDSVIITNANELLLGELGKDAGLKNNFEFTQDLIRGFGISVVSDNFPEQDDYLFTAEMLGAVGDKETLIFLNEEKRHIYFDGQNTDVFKNICPIFITLTSITDGKILDEEVVYLYSKDKELIDKEKNINCERELKYTNVKVDIHSISRSEAEKIKVLEGILEATERRLKDYIENKKKLDERIRELENGK